MDRPIPEIPAPITPAPPAVSQAGRGSDRLVAGSGAWLDRSVRAEAVLAVVVVETSAPGGDERSDDGKEQQAAHVGIVGMWAAAVIRVRPGW